MIQFYLEEKVQNVISAIILKSPKVQTDLLYLRTLFRDSSRSFADQIHKLNIKYQKTKQKLKIYSTDHTSSPFFNADPNFAAQKAKHQRLKSPLNTKKTPEIQQNSYDYSSNIMDLILTQAKSIKTIFDSVIKGETQSSKYVQTAKLLNLYTVYKEFYKSFKQKHKEYVQNYFYDEKHIHKNSTTMKHRLLQELNAESQTRKQLEEKLSALEEMMQRSLMHKDKQLQKLNLKIVNLIKEKTSRDNILCKNCKHTITAKKEDRYKDQDQSIKKEESEDESAQKRKKKLKNEKEEECVLGSISRQKSGQFYKVSDKQKRNNMKVSSQQYLQQKSDRSSQFSSENSSFDEQEMCKTSAEKIKTNKPNVGRFYSGNQTIMTGKVNQTQSQINHQFKDSIQDQMNSLKSQDVLIRTKTPVNNVQRITFGQQPQNLSKKHQSGKNQSGQIDLAKRSSTESLIQHQVNSLREDLKREKEEKIKLEKKIHENQAQYKKLQNEVDELYKMINEAKYNEKNNVQILQTYQNSQTNNYHLGQTEGKQKLQREGTQVYSNRKSMENKQKSQKSKQKKLESFQDCEDYDEIIKMAEQTIHNLSSQSPQERANKRLANNSYSDFGVISPIKGNSTKDDEKSRKKSQSPVKERNKNIPGIKNSGSQNFQGADLNVNAVSPNENGRTEERVRNELPRQAFENQAVEKELENKVKKMQILYEGQCRQKDGQISELKAKTEKGKMQADQLMIMLLLQAFSIEQLISDQEQDESRQNYRNHYAKDFVHG